MIAIMVVMFAFAMVLLINVGSASAADHYVSGSITTDTTWTDGDSYYLIGDVTVVGASLTIEQNVAIYADDGVELIVTNSPDSYILAVGTVGEPITMTANSTQWDGINLQNDATASVFRHVIIENASLGISVYSAGAILPSVDDVEFYSIEYPAFYYWGTDDVTASFSNITVDDVGYGFYFEGPVNVTLSFTDVSVKNCSDIALFVDATGNVTINMVDTELIDNYYAADINADLALSIYVDNVIVNDNSYGLMFESSDMGDVHFVANGCEMINNDYSSVAIFAESGDVYLDIDDSNLMSNDWYTIYIEADEGDLEANVDNSTFDGSPAMMASVFMVDEIDYDWESANSTTTNTFFNTATPQYVGLNFTFFYGGEEYDYVYMNRDGYLQFDSVNSYGGNIDVSRNFIVPCYDVNFEASNWVYFGYDNTTDDKVVFWWHVYNDDPYLNNEFQVVIYDNGDIRFNYADMESTSWNTPNEYGLAVEVGMALDLGYVWYPVAYDADHTSIYLTQYVLGNGAAMGAYANGDMDVAFNNNDVINMVHGGVQCYVENGDLDFVAMGNSFDKSGLDDNMGGFMGYVYNGTVNAAVVDNSFSWMNFDAAYFYSEVYYNGSESLVVTDNVFYEVGGYAAGLFTYAEPAEADFVFESTKVVMDNTGENSGCQIGFVLEVEADEANVTVVLDETVVNNTFEGLATYTEPWDEEAMITSYLSIDVYVGNVNLDRDLVIEDNTNSIDDDCCGIYVTEYVNGIFGDTVRMSDISIMGNTIMDPFLMADDEAVMVYYDYEDDASVYDGSFTSDIVLDIIDNYLESDDDGIDVYIYQYVGYYYDANNAIRGQADSTVNALVNITGNTLVCEDDGIEFWSGHDAQYNWANLYDDIQVLIVDNEVIADDDCIEVGQYAYVNMQHDYSSYGQWVFADYEGNYDYVITGNNMSGEEGIDFDQDVWIDGTLAGAFAGANGVNTLNVLIADNTMAVEDDGICAYLGAGTNYDNAFMESFVTFDVLNNVIVCPDEYDAGDDGIYVDPYVGAYAYSPSMSDETTFLGYCNVTIIGNEISNFEYGVYVDNYAWSDYGLSYAVVSYNFVIEDNIITNISEYGLYICNWYEVDQYEYGDYFSNASMWLDVIYVIQNNVFEGTGSDDAYYGVYVDQEDDTNYDYGLLNASITYWIAGNDISGFEYGVYIDDPDGVDITTIDIYANDIMLCYEGIYIDGANVTIESNMIFECDYGIDVYDSYALIVDNTIADSYYTGLYSYYSDIEVMGNTITDCEDGVYVYGSYDNSALFDGNTISGCEEDGIYAYRMGTFEFMNGEISDCGDQGMHLYNIMTVYINDTVISDCGYSGIYLYGIQDAFVQETTVTGCAIDGYTYAVYANSGYFSYNNLTMIAVFINNGYGGAYMYDLSLAIMEDCEVSFNDYDGVEVYSVDEFYMSYCAIIHNNGDGVYIYFTDFANVAESLISCNDGDGIYMYGSVVELDDCMFSDNVYDAIHVSGNCDVVWYVNGISEVRNDNIYFSGDIIVFEGGELNLINVPDFDFGNYGDSMLQVEEGGSLTMFNMVMHADWDSNINIYGELEMNGVAIHDLAKLYLGPTSDAAIAHSSLEGFYVAGIMVDNCAPSILNTKISEVYYGDGIYVTGEDASPTIMSCAIMFNWRGIYAYQANLEYVVDNYIAFNDLAGIYAEESSGLISDNILVFNLNNIYLKDSDMVVSYNEIGYGAVSQAILYNGLQMAAVVYNAIVELIDIEITIDVVELLYGYISTDSMVSSLLSELGVLDILDGQIGIHALGSNVVCYGNTYGLVETAVVVEDGSYLEFSDTIDNVAIEVPYFDADKALRNVTVYAFVNDGIFARDSVVMVSNAYIEVLDDAIMLFNSEALIVDSELAAIDFDLYCAADSEAVVSDVVMSKVAAVAGSVVDVFETKTIKVVNDDNSTVEGATVEIIDADGNVVANGTTDANGMFSASVMITEYADGMMESFDYTVNVTMKNAKASVAMDDGDDMVITLPGSDGGFTAETALIIAVLIAALLAVALVAMAYRKP